MIRNVIAVALAASSAGPAGQNQIQAIDVAPKGAGVKAEAKAQAEAASAGPVTLAAAREMKSTKPAEAYAALRAIVKASPGSADAKAAQLDLVAMENDDAVAKRVMAGEGRAYSSYSMAKNFVATGQTDKAKETIKQETGMDVTKSDIPPITALLASLSVGREDGLWRLPTK